MQHPSFFTCDLCFAQYDTKAEVNNEVQVANGAETRVYIDVCDRCIKKIGAAIDEAFPRNKYCHKTPSTQA